MTMIPSAPPATAPAAPSSGGAVHGHGSAVSDVVSAFSALVAALTGELTADEASTAALDEAQAAQATDTAPVEDDADGDEATGSAIAAVVLVAAGRPPAALREVTVAPDGAPAGPVGEPDGASPLAEAVASGVEPGDAELAPVSAADESATPGEEPADVVSAEDLASLDVGEGAVDAEPGTGAQTSVDDAAIVPEEGAAADEPVQTAEDVDQPVTVDAAESAGQSEAEQPETSAAPPPVTGAPAGGTDAAPVTDAPDVAPVGAPPAAATAQAEAPPSVSSSPRLPAPALPEQLVSVISPLRRGPDGTHRVAIQLRPDELGEVNIDVRVRGNEISLNLRADLAGTADLLRSALNELRAELEAAGFRAGSFDVAGHGQPGDDRAGADGQRAATTTPTAPGTPDVPVPAPPVSVPSTGLDLRL